MKDEDTFYKLVFKGIVVIFTYNFVLIGASSPASRENPINREVSEEKD